MKHNATVLVIVVVLLIVSIAANSGVTQAQSGGGYDLTWSTIDSGGAMFSIGGAYSLGGTIGQFDANATPMTGGSYSLNGGFWVDFLGNRIMLPLILK